MTAQIYYFSTNVAAGEDRPFTVAGTGASGSLNQGTTTTDFAQTTDYFYFGIKTITTGTTQTNVTKRQALHFLEQARRWVLDGSQGSAGGQGLDYCIAANTGSYGVP